MIVVNIINRSESGLAADAEIIASALGAMGCRVRALNTDRPRALRLLSYAAARVRKRLGQDTVVNLHCEQIAERFIDCAHRNVLIPNQEWAWPRTQELLGRMDAIFCKTRYATGIYAVHGNAVFTGFSSHDRHDPRVDKDFGAFLHLAGKSQQKGTRTLASLWSRHPEWPTLHIVSRRQGLLDGIAGSNIVHVEHLAQAELRTLQNRCGVHLCPSEAEGYGHSIGEGLGTGALVLTTDAPPMNELVTPERGVLVPFASRQTQGLGSNFYVDEGALEAAIVRILGMDRAALQACSAAARGWFLENRRAFVTRLTDALQTLATSRPDA